MFGSLERSGLYDLKYQLLNEIVGEKPRFGMQPVLDTGLDEHL